MSTATDAELAKLGGKINAIIDILSNRQTDSLDGQKIRRFIDNYAFLDAVINNESIDSMIQNISITKDRFDSVSSRLDGILGAAELESTKLAESLGNGSSSIALSAANSAIFQASVFDSNKNMLQHLSDLNVSGKLQDMDSALSEALGLIRSLRDQKTQIDTLFERISENKELIDGQADVNDEQARLIENSQTLVVELEKQIENYSFFAEEFDKIYVTARDFIKIFSSLVDTMNHIKDRDAKVEAMLVSATSSFSEELAAMDDAISKIQYSVEFFASETSQKINDMAMFINEFKAISIELDSFRIETEAVRDDVDSAMARLSVANIEVV